jgi:response regulator RpfG family c-di-GMP phosphodiesterase
LDKWKVLIVEDDIDMHEVTKLSLKRFEYGGRRLEFHHAMSAEEGKDIMAKHDDMAVVLLDVVMESDHAGLDFVHYVRRDLKNDMVQIILRTGQPGYAPENKVIFEYDINDYQEKSELTSQKLKTSIVTALRSYQALHKIAHQNDELKDLYRQLETTQNDIFYTLGEIAESRTSDMGNHVKRVGEIAGIIASEYGISKDDVAHLKLAATMHDIGKLAIPEHILNKPGKLSPEEFDVMKRHADFGHDMLNASNREILQLAAIIAGGHHENFDGTGYPKGLVGEAINVYCRIVSIADVFDALGNKRVYKGAWEHEDIITYIMNEKGKKFDPKLIDCFMNRLDDIVQIREMYPD